MNAMVFDTHNFVKRLTAEGMPIGQAEVLAALKADMTFQKWMSGLILAGISSLILKTFF